jgi:hypothetical protein
MELAVTIITACLWPWPPSISTSFGARLLKVAELHLLVTNNGEPARELPGRQIPVAH